MAVADVVEVLMEYHEDGEEAFENRHGPGAAIAMRDVTDLLRSELGGQLDYDALWAEFEAAPRETTPELIGVLEALVEADPGLGDKLGTLLEDYYAIGRQMVAATGDEAAASPDSTVVRREQTSVEEQEAVSRPGRAERGHTDESGEGTYLYGNVRTGGQVSVGRREGLDLDVLEARGELEISGLDLRTLFQQLRCRAERDPTLAEATREALLGELGELAEELMLGDEGDEGRLVEHLRQLGEMDTDYLELVLTGLWHTAGGPAAAVEQAIMSVSGSDIGSEDEADTEES